MPRNHRILAQSMDDVRDEIAAILRKRAKRIRRETPDAVERVNALLEAADVVAKIEIDEP